MDLSYFFFGDRKQDNQNNEAGKLGQGVQGPRILLQNNTEPEITGDGFRWRKYGQKVVKGNPFPRLVLMVYLVQLCLDPAYKPCVTRPQAYGHEYVTLGDTVKLSSWTSLTHTRATVVHTLVPTH